MRALSAAVVAAALVGGAGVGAAQLSASGNREGRASHKKKNSAAQQNVLSTASNGDLRASTSGVKTSMLSAAGRQKKSRALVQEQKSTAKAAAKVTGTSGSPLHTQATTVLEDVYNNNARGKILTFAPSSIFLATAFPETSTHTYGTAKVEGVATVTPPTAALVGVSAECLI